MSNKKRNYQQLKARRFKKRETDPLKQYKLSPVDKESQKLWDKYTIAKFSMLMSSNTDVAPWTVVKSDDKKKARINCIKHILSQVVYPDMLSSDEIQTNKKILVSGTEELENMEQENKFAKA